MSKYKLTDKYIEYDGRKLYRIEALIDIQGTLIKAGDKGGFVESERNLAQVSGAAWVYDDAQVSGDAQVYGDARVYGAARVSGDAQVYGDARVYGDAWVYGAARVSSQMHIKHGKLIIPVETFKEIEYIAATLNHYPINGEYALYKRVNKISDGVYASCRDKGFVYKTGKWKSVKDADPDIKRSCSSGIHVSTPEFWHEGDTIIALKIKLSDIITCLEGKVRAKRVFVIGECYSERLA